MSQPDNSKPDNTKLRDNMYSGSFAGSAICMSMIAFTAIHKASYSEHGDLTEILLPLVHHGFIITNCIFLLVAQLAFKPTGAADSLRFKLSRYCFYAAMVLMALTTTGSFFYFTGQDL